MRARKLSCKNPKQPDCADILKAQDESKRCRMLSQGKTEEAGVTALQRASISTEAKSCSTVSVLCPPSADVPADPDQDSNAVASGVSCKFLALRIHHGKLNQFDGYLQKFLAFTKSCVCNGVPKQICHRVPPGEPPPAGKAATDWCVKFLRSLKTYET